MRAAGMGAAIEAIAASEIRSESSAASSIELAADAALQALADTCTVEDVGLLINTGVYRDENIGEPAMAPLIQRRIDAQAALLGASQIGASQAGASRSSTFSFDISNGACGLITGLEVASGFISSGSVTRGLVVASDVNPTPGVSENLTCAPIGAAVLLARGTPTEGFTAFQTDTYAKYSDRSESLCRWLEDDERVASAPAERHAIRVNEAEDYVAQCAQAASRSLSRFLDEHEFCLEDIDLIVPSQAPAGFSQAFAAEAPPDVRLRCADPLPDITGLHTVGPGLAMAAALASDSGVAASNLLFIAAGSGITIALALYTKPRGTKVLTLRHDIAGAAP
jgi:3-oxoacyl-[acyl-carrier-protein] synthase-3